MPQGRLSDQALELLRIAYECSDDVEMNELDIYYVEKILAVKTSKNNAQPAQYLLKWEGYKYNASTWCKEDDVACGSHMEEFLERQNIRNSIAQLRDERIPDFYNSKSFYACQVWEDEMNATLRETGQAPIYVENWVDNAKRPPNFKYITQNEFHPIAKREEQLPIWTNFQSCNCTDNTCGSSNPCCVPVSPYTTDGRLDDKLERNTRNIVECSEKCKCDINCPTRLTQRGRQIPVVIFRESEKGWGIRAGAKIKANAFVMEYVGEVVTVKQAEKHSPTYQFEIKVSTTKKLTDTFVIDATKNGNEARFVNHSCEPNMVVEPIFSLSSDPRYHRFAFFAKRDIEQGEELTINYHPNMDKAKIEEMSRVQKLDFCYCGAENCCKYFY